MKTSFGPWTTAIYSGANAQLSTLWKRRLALLSLTSQSSSTVSRSVIATLSVVALVVCMLPTLSGVRAVANTDQSPAEEENQKQKARFLEALSSAATVKQDTRIPFRIRSREFQGEDDVTIESFVELDPKQSLHRYEVQGRYRLESRPDAKLMQWCSNGTLRGNEGIDIKRGEGKFHFTYSVVKNGDLHISYYPVQGGNSFGSIYYEPVQGQPSQTKSLAAPDATASEELTESWRRTIRIPYPLYGEGHTYVIWVEGGWLHVKRQTARGETDWHIVLARATDPTPPTVLADKRSGLVEFSYRDGRYFVREDVNNLRCIREIKRGEDGTWPRSYFLNDNFRNVGSAGSPSRHQITGWNDDTWRVAATGPAKERFDCIVRLRPVDMTETGSVGFTAWRGGTLKWSRGDSWLTDDGQMLVATRILEFQYNAYLVKENLPGSPAPALVGTAWLNTEGPLALDDLRGKVVLLDFWGTWCMPCVEKMPDVQALHEKYHDKGLVVIGVHSAQGADTCEEFAEKNNITFPLVLDTGKTVENYAAPSFPSYFLIDKTGKVTAPASTRVPEEREIERLLSQ